MNHFYLKSKVTQLFTSNLKNVFPDRRILVHERGWYFQKCNGSMDWQFGLFLGLCIFKLFLVSNGGKFVKKTLIGEAYIWLDKVDMRKRVVSWHKLLVSSTQTNPWALHRRGSTRGEARMCLFRDPIRQKKKEDEYEERNWRNMWFLSLVSQLKREQIVCEYHILHIWSVWHCQHAPPPLGLGF